MYISIKRVRGLAFGGTSPAATPLCHSRNVTVYPNRVLSAVTTIGLMPADLYKDLAVQFEGDPSSSLHRDGDIRADVVRLRAAFFWLGTNCWPWMEATKYAGMRSREQLGEQLETLLVAYGVSIGGATGVPAELIQSATRIQPEAAATTQAGPADAVAGEEAEDEEPHMAQDDAPQAECAAVIHGGTDDFSPLQLWDRIMRMYGVAQACEESIKAVDAKQNPSERERLLRERSVATAAAVQALSRLKNRETQRKLEEFRLADEGKMPPLKFVHSEETLSSFDPRFWCMCFTHLFCRGDCLERHKRVKPLTHVPEYRWAKCLVTRADIREWRMDVEFVACLYNVLLRRSQIRAVQMTMKRVAFSQADIDALRETTVQDLVSHALSSGDCDSVRQLLRRENLEVKVKKTFQTMQMAQRKVRGSEAQRESVHFRFRALRIWGGCSSLFFTLNPPRHPKPFDFDVCEL